MVLSRLLATALLVALPARAITDRRAPITPLPSFAEPSISPDHTEIAFASGGDIWTVPARGGQAQLLVSHTANEARPVYSPDGKKLAFLSNREGAMNVYVLTFAGGTVDRITWDDQNESLDSWSHDGKWIYFSSASRDISSMNDIWRVAATGGTPMQVSADRYASEYWGTPSPDGTTLAFTARGVTSSQWWRLGRSHLDESEIWLLHDDGSHRYERVGEAGGSKDAWPMWSADGKSLYYVSDRSGSPNLWVRPATGGAATRLTTFSHGRVLWPQISEDGKAIVFERDFHIWSYDVERKVATQVPITLRGAAAGPGIDHLTLSTGAGSLALSPDAKKIAFIVRGDVFAASAKDGGDAVRVTSTPGAETRVVWAPDSRRIVYSSERDGTSHLYLYDFGTRTETQLTTGTGNDVTPRFSSDGRLVAYVHGGHELRVIDPTSHQDRLLATGAFSPPPFLPEHAIAWSPDNQWVTYLTNEQGGFTNAYVVPVGGGPARAVSFLPNGNSGTVAWSPNGEFLLLNTGQRTEQGEIVRVDLIPRTPHFREDQFRDLFGPVTDQPRSAPARRDSSVRPTTDSGVAVPPVRKATRIVFDDIRARATLIPTGGMDASNVAISPDGKTAVIAASAGGQGNLYTWSLDDAAAAAPVMRQLTSTAGGKGNVQWSPDSKEIWFTEGGHISAINVETRAARTVNVSAEMDVDFAAEKMAVFDMGWAYLRDNFFDSTYNGVDWNAVHTRYAPQIAGARTPDEMRRLMMLMVGELNSSHSGINGPGVPASTGRLGVRYDRAEYERNGRLRIGEILPLSPMALAANVKTGDYITAINGVAVTAHTNADQMLGHTIGKETTLTLSSAADGSGTREVSIKPVDAATEKALLYRAWVESRRAYVEKISGGRLGYVHMIDMGQPSLNQLILDLDTENRHHDGVVIDIRNNNGGFVNGYAIDIFARRGYLNMTSRTTPTAPARNALGQRALDLPSILVTNQHSLSDAEDFSEGYRANKLGKIVGEPTAGWIVYTSNVTLGDGQTVIRLPSTRITTASGANMEMHPRPVDIEVVRPIGESYSGRDSQLDAAVKELLAELPPKGKS